MRNVLQRSCCWVVGSRCSGKEQGLCERHRKGPEQEEMRSTKPGLNTKGMGIGLFRYNFCPQQRTGEQKGPEEEPTALALPHGGAFTRVRSSAGHEGDFSNNFLVLPKSTPSVGTLECLLADQTLPVLPKEGQLNFGWVISTSSHDSGILSQGFGNLVILTWIVWLQNYYYYYFVALPSST